MFDIQPVTLSGHWVRLEPLTEEHAADLSHVTSDEEIWQYMPVNLSRSSELHSWIATAVAAQVTGEALPFAIVDQATGRAIGSTRYFDIRREHRSLEIGWTWLARSAWRTPVNTECKYLLLGHAFDTLGCIRVQLKTDRRNERSRRAIERLGAREEGTLRRHMILRDGTYRDSVYYSIIDTEWPQVKQRLGDRLYGNAGVEADIG